MESSGLTALHEAARHGNLQVITTLLSHKATIDPLPLPHAPLSPAPQYGYNGRRRREAEEEEHEIDEHTWITPLYAAVDNGQREVVKELVSHGAKILPHIEMLAAQLGDPGTSSFSSPSFSLSLFFLLSLIYQCINVEHTLTVNTTLFLPFTLYCPFLLVSSHPSPLSPILIIFAEILEILVQNCESMRGEHMMLYWAALNGRREAVQILVKNGITKLHFISSSSPLHLLFIPSSSPLRYHRLPPFLC